MSDNPVMIQTLADALQERGYTQLTPVQEAVIQAEHGQADLLVSAQTGSGKTVGFGLAIAPTLLDAEGRFDAAGKPLALVIAPTRELALQVKRELAWLYAKTGAVVASCVGGMDMRDERRALDRGAHIVVATPGRLRDHIQRGSLDMTELRAVVLDEADEMLDLGFREDLEFILGEAPESRRTLMFSATVPRGIAALAQGYQKDAVRVTTTAERSQHADIEYRALTVAAHDAENAIINVLRFYDAQNALVFCNTRAMVNRLTTRFSNRGFSVVALSGELSQSERTHALQAMRDGRARVCVATDVAARGIDLPNLELVVHADLPTNGETLLHRSGRTGRAGRKGVSALIVPVKMRKKAENLLRFAKVNPEWAAPPSAEEVFARDEERLLADPTWAEPVSEDEADFVGKLTGRYTPDQIAAAFLRLYRSRQSAPEELSSPGTETAPRPHAAFGPGTWFSVSLGRDQNAEARRLLPMLCRAGNLNKDDIGAIRVRESESFVEILSSSVPQFLKAVGDGMTLETGVTVSQLDSPPVLDRAPPGAKPARAKPARKDYGDKPAADKPKYDKPKYEKPAYEKPAYDKPKSEKPAYEKPAYEKPAADASPTGDEAPAPRKPRHKDAGGKPAGKPAYGKSDDRKSYGKPADRPAPFKKKPGKRWEPDTAPTDAPAKPYRGDKPAGGKPYRAKGDAPRSYDKPKFDGDKRPRPARDSAPADAATDRKPRSKGPAGNAASPSVSLRQKPKPGGGAGKPSYDKPRVGKGANAKPRRPK